MKRRLIIVVAVALIVGSCSAPWHLKRAIEKDPDILTIVADTTYKTSVTFQDTSIYLEAAVPLTFVIDTGRVDTHIVVRKEKPTFGPIRAYSKDSTAVAEAGMDDGNFYLMVWGRVDTTVNYRDSVVLQNRIIDSLVVVNRRNEAVIEERESFIKQAARWVGVFGGAFMMAVVGVLVLMLRKVQQTGQLPKPKEDGNDKIPPSR